MNEYKVKQMIGWSELEKMNEFTFLVVKNMIIRYG